MRDVIDRVLQGVLVVGLVAYAVAWAAVPGLVVWLFVDMLVK